MSNDSSSHNLSAISPLDASLVFHPGAARFTARMNNFRIIESSSTKRTDTSSGKTIPSDAGSVFDLVTGGLWGGGCNGGDGKLGFSNLS